MRFAAGVINGLKNKINHEYRIFDCDEGGDEGVDYDMVPQHELLISMSTVATTRMRTTFTAPDVLDSEIELHSTS